MELKFKKLVEGAVIPKRANDTDAGLDLIATSKKVEMAKNEDGLEDHREVSFIEYGTGLAVEIPVGFVGLLFPRSSVTNKQMMLKNSVGVIDSGYRGEIKARFMCSDKNEHHFHYAEGDKIAQLLIVPVFLPNPVEVDELSDSSRGEGGFGSTGN